MHVGALRLKVQREENVVLCSAVFSQFCKDIHRVGILHGLLDYMHFKICLING